MSEKLMTTTDYSMFTLHRFNREVKKISDLEKSMRKYGWISAYPMHVVKNGDGLLRIKGGHHRYTVAKKIGIPVKYIVCEDGGVAIHELEKGTKPWSMADYLNSYYALGNPHYICVKEYSETGIPLMACISLCAGETAGSHNHLSRFKAGTYRIGHLGHAGDVRRVVIALKQIGFTKATTTMFVHGLSRVLRVKEFCIDTFIKRASVNPGLLVPQPNQASYIDMIEAIYNHASKKKRLPLAFLAQEEAIRRQSAPPSEKL